MLTYDRRICKLSEWYKSWKQDFVINVHLAFTDGRSGCVV